MAPAPWTSATTGALKHVHREHNGQVVTGLRHNLCDKSFMIYELVVSGHISLNHVLAV